MLIEGEADSRTPSGSGGMTMFRALKALHRPDGDGLISRGDP